MPLHGSGYILADQVAEQFADLAGHVDAPVLDFGCGGGLVGVALVRDTAGEGVDWVIDGVDSSAALLVEAGAQRGPAGKPLYRQLVEADLSQPLGDRDDLVAGSYAGVLTAGTFSVANFGPDVLRTLIPLGRPGALFAIGIEAEHFQEHGFAELLDDERSAGRIRGLDPRIVEMYAPGRSRSDQAVVAIFRRS